MCLLLHSGSIGKSLGVRLRDSQKMLFDFQELMHGSQCNSSFRQLPIRKMNFDSYKCTVLLSMYMIFFIHYQEYNKVKVKILVQNEFIVQLDFQNWLPGLFINEVRAKKK